MPISMPVDAEANELLTRSPLALLIAMLLDQQVPLERAFSAPRDLVRRLGHEPTAEELAAFNPEELAAIAFGKRCSAGRSAKTAASSSGLAAASSSAVGSCPSRRTRSRGALKARSNGTC